MLIHKLTDKEKALIAEAQESVTAAHERVREIGLKLEAVRLVASEAIKAKDGQIKEIRELHFDNKPEYETVISDDGEYLVYQLRVVSAISYPGYQDDILRNIAGRNYNTDAQRGRAQSGMGWVGHPV